MYHFFKKVHKWVGLVIVLIIVVFSISGIILNHRQTFSSVDVSRKVLADEYSYQNWNNAAVRGSVKTDANGILLYGNVGVWQTDSSFIKFNDFNAGFPRGIDNRKIFKVLATNNELLAATLFGLYEFNQEKKQWVRVPIPVHEENVVDLLQKGDSIFVLTRSNLLVSTNLKDFKIIDLPPPVNYDHKVGLFKTLWVIHSGEIYGTAGKLLVDLVAIVFVFLGIGGVILFFTKRRLKTNLVDKLKRNKLRDIFKWNLKWHNKVGWMMVFFLFITTLTGIFLRPPLLIAIANSRVNKIPFTKLDTPNPWFDVLRRIIYIPDLRCYVVSTSEGFYHFNESFTWHAKLIDSQPPSSIMGVTVLEHPGGDELMVGSFAGLYKWNITNGRVVDLIKNEPYVHSSKFASPIGEYKISGFSKDFHNQLVAFDYDRGSLTVGYGKKFPDMPDVIINSSPMSLWNLALEVHTGRIFGSLIGMLYILIVPLGGILIFITLLTGIVIWFKFHAKRKKKEGH